MKYTSIFSNDFPLTLHFSDDIFLQGIFVSLYVVKFTPYFYFQTFAVFTFKVFLFKHHEFSFFNIGW